MMKGVHWANKSARDSSGNTQEVTVVAWDDETDEGIARLSSDFSLVSVSCPGSTLLISEESIDFRPLENEIIAHMRACIAALDDTDSTAARDEEQAAHGLFGVVIGEWSDEFANLYEQMMQVYRAKTPHPTGHYRRRSIEVGFTSYQTQHWVNDKVQPPIPTAIELVARFDTLVSGWLTSPVATAIHVQGVRKAGKHE
jgi:hypothetical protein